MKLLGWMHRKFRQNSSEPFKDLVIGQPAVVDDEVNYPKPNFGSKHVKQSENYHRKISLSFGGVEDDEYEEESSGGNGMYELFHGFLTIGTLGSEQVGYSDPSTTPTFAFYVENITEKGDEVSENELKVINEELEKVLGKEDGSSNYNYDSSGRNSHAGSRSSYSYSYGYGSTITVLSGKPKELGTEYSSTTAVCPLQGYLFGSAIELSETTKAAAKKEHRTSLGELFQRSKLAEDHNCGPKSEKDIIDHKKTDREEADNHNKSASSAMHLMKKKLKKRMQLHTTYSRATTGGPVVDSASAEKKLHKILHMFHRKVHPENSQKCDKHQKNEKKKKKKKKKIIMNEVGRSGNNKSEVVHPDPEEDKDIMLNLHPKIRALANAKESMRQNKSQSNSLHLTLDSTEDSWENENREHWIKTDADYLVLEL